MSLYVVFKSKNFAGRPNHIELHVPFGKSYERPDTEKEEIDYVQADGDELDYVLNTFIYLPRPLTGKPVVKWFGDDAKFIYFNL